MLGWQTAFQRFKTASNNYNNNPTQHRNLVPSSKAAMIRQGKHRYSSTSKRKLGGRLATQRNVLSNVAQALCPIIRMEENFTSVQFVPDVLNPATGTAGAFAPPMANGQIGSYIYQSVSPTTIQPCIYDVATVYPAANSGTQAQAVQWQASYLKKEQNLLLLASGKGQLGQLNLSNQIMSNNTDSGNLNAQGNPIKDFVFRGATTVHTFINTGNTQCSFTLLEFVPRRFGNITPEKCWEYDLTTDHSGLAGNAAPTTLAAGVGQAQRNHTKLGMRPGQVKNGMFNYWFRKVSSKTFHMEPGEELKYKQKYAPWIDRQKMRDIYLSSYDAAGTEPCLYDTHSRYLCFIGHGETTKFTSIADGVTGAFNGSWSISHNQRRYSSYQCLLPSKRNQLSIIDSNDTFIGTGAITESDLNEAQDTMHTVAI